MVAETEILCSQSVSVQYYSAKMPTKIETEFFDVSSAAVAVSPTDITTTSPRSQIFRASDTEISIEICRSESARCCSTSTQSTTALETPSSRFVPSICSGSHSDIGPRRYNEDEHIRIDDLSVHLGSLYRWSQPSSFYAVFDGHGGSDAAAYVKNNAMKFFFEDANLPQTSDDDEKFFQDLERAHRKAFSSIDLALADEQSSVDSYCGTTALTALVLGRYLLIANVGDCRAVLCRKGVAVQLSHDHRSSCLLERERVENLGGTIQKGGYLNGELTVTRSLGDWYMKLPLGSPSPLIAEPDVQQTLLTEDDEFLIIGCDGIWDRMSNQEAVSLVRRELRHTHNPQQCAQELVNQALRLNTGDNVTAIVVCFSSLEPQNSVVSQRPRFRFCLAEEARKKLQSLLGGN
ncbi:unnamed protein product [Fraxinus pennsylvanica]|uniref:protein-serine/threonine phosphatase n=1 Tax=Fraxinus pennsylvanica TaxID=56036 RepID=A0AAD1ZF37_9LAMI|nr:unnamed protein product [Fraxinus pennsylvanica]